MRRPATVTDTPPLSLTAPAARSQSGRSRAIHLAPASPPASSSAAAVNSTSRRRPGIGSRAGSSPAARASATSRRMTPSSIAIRSFMSTAPRPYDVAAGDVGGERIVRPALRRRRDDVEVREQQDRLATGPVAAQPDVDRAATGHGLDDLGLQPFGRQLVGDVPRDDELLVRAGRVGRIDRGDADEVAQRRDERLVGGGPGRVAQLARRGGGDPVHEAADARAMISPTTNPPRISTMTIQSSSRP